MYGYRTGWRPRPKQGIPLRQQGITGIRDNLDPSASAPDKAFSLHNIYPLLPQQGGGLAGRPGFAEFLANADGTGTGWGQRSFTLVKSDRTRWTLTFVAGKLSVLNWGARTGTDLTASLPHALSAVNKIAIIEFEDGVYFHDGVSKPIYGTVNSGTGVWTFTEVTNAPVLYGPVVEYYGKVTGVRNDERTVLVWSEELDPFLGYETAPYNNAWEMTQGGTGAIYALVATNEGLYYFREDGISMVVGPTSDEFLTPGTEDSISDTIGTTSPWSVVKAGRDSIFFLDQMGRPQRVIRNSGVQSPGIWEDAFETTRSLPRDMLEEALGCYWGAGEMVLFAVSTRTGIRPELVMGFHSSSGSFLTTWGTRAGNRTFCSLDAVRDDDNTEVLMHTNDRSQVFDWGDPHSGSVWDDDGQAIDHQFEGGALGYSHGFQLGFERVDFSLRMESTLTDMRFGYRVPKGIASEYAASLSGGIARWDEVLWDEFVWAGDTLEEHLPVGFYDEGRWIQIRLRHSGLGERFALLGYTVLAHGIGAIPSAR